MTLGVGGEFAGYTIERQLGSGGMGEVYLARHPRLPRSDALKILREDISADTAFRERFIREADSIAGLSHPNIVSVYDRGENGGLLWIATQFVDGTDAAKLLKGRYPAGMPVDFVAAVVSAIADALDYAHEEKGLLHRDVKPANILLAKPTSDGTQRIYLADFGIARPLDDPAGLTATNFTVGTVAYAAPEQLMGQPISGHADQYALAATAFHLLTGFPPYRDPNPITVISQHLTQPPPLLSTMRRDLPALDPVMQKAMAKDPQQRYPRCSDFARALSEAHQHVVDPSAATQHATPTAHRRFTSASNDRAAQPVSGRRSRAVPLLAAVGVAFTAALVYAGTQFGKTSHTVESAPTTTTATSVAPPSSQSPASPAAPTAPSSTAAAPTSIRATDIASLMLSTEQVQSIAGGLFGDRPNQPQLVSNSTEELTDYARLVDPPQCAGVLFGNDTSTFTPWPSVAVLDQTTDVKVAGAGYKSPYATGEPWWSVEQTAALFTSATYAQQFVDSQTEQWRACTKASHEPPGWVGEPLDGKIQVLQRYPEDTSQFNEAQLRGTGGFGTINWTLGDVTTDKSSTSMKMVGNSSDWMTPHPSEPGRGAYLACQVALGTKSNAVLRVRTCADITPSMAKNPVAFGKTFSDLSWAKNYAQKLLTPMLAKVGG